MNLLAVQWSNTITLGSVLIGIVIAMLGLAEMVHLVRRKNLISDLEHDIVDLQREMENADRAAKRWEVERNAADAAVQRLKLEHLEQTAQLQEEQREVRHQLKNDLAACQLELSAANARTDQTIVVEGQRAIGTALLDGQKTIVDVVERMEERAARRDSAMLENQKKIAQALETLADRVTEKVADAVQDQLRNDPPAN